VRFDCTPFLFYVVIEQDSTFAGYFSKEYGETVEHNLSCILVLPHCQRKGYGKFLIEFSYTLSKLEGRKGTPERPLSDLGFRSYVVFWAIRIIRYLLESSASKMTI
jgi:GNAT superfamily N-acetyltransferase